MTSVEEQFLRENPQIARLIEKRTTEELKLDGRFELRGVFCFMPDAAEDTVKRYIKNTDEARTVTPYNKGRTGDQRTLMEQLRKGGLRKVEFVQAPPE